MIAENLASVQHRIAMACEKIGRSADSVCLVAVTKTVGEEEIRELYRLGVRDFGENRVDVLAEKLVALADLADINWHFIGHLQRNKAKKILADVTAIHSVESEGLLKIIETLEYPLQVFIEVNISGEESKYGGAIDDATQLIKQYMDSVNIVGLMTMAPFYADSEDTRPVFAGLKKMQDDLQEGLALSLPYLSMGMSNDFEVAIEEGATHVRVGSELFKQE